MNPVRRELLFSLVLALLCTALLFLDIAGIPQDPSGIRCPALITKVDNSKTHPFCDNQE